MIFACARWIKKSCSNRNHQDEMGFAASFLRPRLDGA